MNKPLTADQLWKMIGELLETADWTQAEDYSWTAREKIMAAVKDHVEYIIGPGLSIELPSGNIDPRKEAINEEKAAARNRAGEY